MKENNTLTYLWDMLIFHFMALRDTGAIFCNLKVGKTLEVGAWEFVYEVDRDCLPIRRNDAY